MKKAAAVLLIIATLFILPAPAQRSKTRSKKTKPAAANAKPDFGNIDSIKASSLKAHLEFIAADELEGRDTPSRGINIAAKYIASHLSRLGLKPAGDEDSYFQRISMTRSAVNPSNTKVELNGASFVYGNDFLVELPEVKDSGKLVYVGYGWMIKSMNIDPFAAIPMKDKIAVVVRGLPKDVEFRDLVRGKYGKRGEGWLNPEGNALKHGAKGIIEISSPDDFTKLKESKLESTEDSFNGIDPFRSNRRSFSGIPTINASPRMTEAIFKGEQISYEDIMRKASSGESFEPFELNAEKRIDFSISAKTQDTYTQNVAAVLEGEDPVLKNEYVAIGAHYDHVGKGSLGVGRMGPKNGGDAEDITYNGADDDGSGTVALLELAEAFSKGPRVKRSILFVWHCGEEKGLIGSRYFTAHPTVPLDKIIAQLNIDMIGRSKKEGDANPANIDLTAADEIYVVGSKKMSTDLGNVSESVNQSLYNLKFNYKYDDPQDPTRIFYRSDHYNYAQKGIPIIFYFDGVHEDYHRPSDEVSKIDFQKMEKVTRTIYATAWRLAESAERPRVDKPLS